MNILSHLKFFDPHLDDNDKQNFYMEREWRVMRQVRFRLVDVTRIVLPERFARRFRRDVSRYDGEVVFGRTRQAVGVLVSTDPIDCFRNRSPDVFLLRQMRKPKHVMGEVFC